jgi:hypothetical protein
VQRVQAVAPASRQEPPSLSQSGSQAALLSAVSQPSAIGAAMLCLILSHEAKED